MGRRRKQKRSNRKGWIIPSLRFGKLAKMAANMAAKMGKMSDVLVEIAQPVIELVDQDDPDDVQFAIQLAALVWNASQIGHSAERIASDLASLEPFEPSEVELPVLVEHLLERKRIVAPNDRRFVMDVRSTIENGELRVIAATAFAPPTAERIASEQP